MNWLTLLMFLPLVGAAVVSVLPKANEKAAKQAALITTIAVLLVTIGMTLSFERENVELQFVEKYAEYQGKSASNPDEDLEHSRLMRLFSISEKYYTMLLEKKTEFSISKAGFVSQNVILEEAISDGSWVFPNKK